MTQSTDNNDPERAVSSKKLVEKARQLVKAGHLKQAFAFLYSAIRFAEDTGYPQIAFLLIEKVNAVLDVEQLELTDKAWLLNSKGLALQSLGRLKESEQAFTDMKKLGNSLNDKQIIATSQMNLGICALLIGNTKLACEFLNHSLTINHEIGNYRDATKIRLNLISVYIQVGDLEAAEAQLSIVRELVEAWKDPHLQATFYGNAGTINAKRGNFDNAQKYYQMALKSARQSGDKGAEITTLRNMGALHIDEGLPLKALSWFRRALKIAKTTGSIVFQEAIVVGLAVSFHQAGRMHEAAESFGKARNIARQLGNRHAEARYSADLGAVLLSLKEIKSAMSILQEALAIFKETDDREWRYRVLRNMIEAHWANGDREISMQILKQALATLTPKSYFKRAELLGRAAQLWLRDREEIRQASYYYNRQLSEYKKLEKLETLAWHTALAGAALAEAGGTKLSIPFYTHAIELYRSLDNGHMLFHSLNDRAIAYSDLGRYKRAIDDYKSCMNIAEKFDDRVMRLQTLLNWGETTRRKGNIREAISKLKKAVSLSRKLVDREAEAESLANLGIALSDAKQWKDAHATFHLARDIAHAIKQYSIEASATGGLARVAFVKGRFKTASKLYGKAAQLRSNGKIDRQFLEDLAGLIESLAAARKNIGIEREAQRLVDFAQQNLETELASEALMRAARWFLKYNEFEAAASLYATGIAIAGVGPEDDLINRLSKACLLMAFHVQTDAKEQEEFFELVISQLNKNYEGIGENLRNLVSLARQQVAQHDNIRQ